MELKDLLGEEFKDGITVDEINSILADKNFISKEIFDKTASELAAIKRNSKANEGTLTAQLNAQKAQIEQLTINANKQETARILAESGMSKDDYSPFLDAIVGMDAERNATVAEAIAKAFKAHGEEAANKAKSEIISGAPKPSGGPPSGFSKEDFNKMSFSEQHKFSIEHPTEYRQFFE